MFERFTDRARRVVVLAQVEAQMLNHDYIGTQHVLLGLIHEGEGVAAMALESLGISLEAARAQVEEIMGQAEQGEQTEQAEEAEEAEEAEQSEQGEQGEEAEEAEEAEQAEEAEKAEQGELGEEGEQAPSSHLAFTPRGKKVLELSLREAVQLNHSYVGTEHILLGLLREGEGVAAQVLVKLGANLNRVRNQVLQLLSGFQGKEVVVTLGAPTVLDQFGRNLTRAASENKLDLVIGRETEIERVMQVLSRRTKNNPVLVAEPGIDTSAVVEGLAQAVVRGDVPDTLSGTQIYRLDLQSLLNIAGTDDNAGDTESNVLKDLRTRDDIVCFIDQLHTMFLPGLAKGGVAMGSALKEMMSSGNLRTIGATTPDEYRMYIAKDDTLEHLFQSIEVKAPSIPHAIDILRGLRDRYEAYHRVTITDEALVAAAMLADRYVSDRFLPDSALDIIDEAGSRLRMRLVTAPPDLREFDEKVAAVRLEKEVAIDAQDFERAKSLRDDERMLLTARAEREAQWRSGDVDIVGEVDGDAIVEAVAHIAHLEPADIRRRVKEELEELPNIASSWIEGERAFVLLGDQPVFQSSDDLLNTAEIASRIASILVDSHESSPFVMAIDGSWGVGKSTLLRQIEAHLPQQSTPNNSMRRSKRHQNSQQSAERHPALIPVQFNAWTAQGEGALEGLIKSVLIKLDANVVRRGIRELARRQRLVWVARFALGILAHFLGVGRLIDRVWDRLDADPQARNELRTFIGQVLSEWVSKDGERGAGRALVVFIDDLDRCSDDVVVQVCEAVKLYLDAPGLIFVIACDLSVISRSVSGSARGDESVGRTYLEKIVQVAHRVPTPDNDAAKRLILGYAERSGTVDLIDEAVINILSDRTGRNPRRIKRILNSFVLEYHLDQRWKVHPLGSVPLLTAVLLQHLYPSFYDWLVREPGGIDPIEEFLDYADVRVRATDPPPRNDAWWSTVSDTFRRHAMPPPARSPVETGPLLSALEQLEVRLPKQFPRLAFDQAFVGLLKGAGDRSTTRALRAQLVSRPLGS